ncbi:unnamed protein product, partial [Pylaiella littoralis]
QPPDPGIVRQPTSNTNPWKHSYGAFPAQAAHAVVETSAVQQQTPGGHQQQQQQEYAARLQQSQQDARITSQQPSPPQQATYRYTTAASSAAPLSSSDPSPGLHGAGRSLMALSVPEGEFVFSGEGFAASEIDF